MVAHHARTGKAGAASATGFDRSSFGRNSKVLLGWMRAQINVAPYEGDDNATLVIASAKCNNAEEFKPFGVRLNKKTLWYERDDSLDLDAWRERVSGDGSAKPKVKKSPPQIKDIITKLVPETGTVPKYEVIAAANAAGIGRDDVRDYMKICMREGRFCEIKMPSVAAVVKSTWCAKKLRPKTTERRSYEKLAGEVCGPPTSPQTSGISDARIVGARNLRSSSAANNSRCATAAANNLPRSKRFHAHRNALPQRNASPLGCEALASPAARVSTLCHHSITMTGRAKTRRRNQKS